MLMIKLINCAISALKAKVSGSAIFSVFVAIPTRESCYDENDGGDSLVWRATRSVLSSVFIKSGRLIMMNFSSLAV